MKSLYNINLKYFQPVELLWSPSGRLNSIGETFVPFLAIGIAPTLH